MQVIKRAFFVLAIVMPVLIGCQKDTTPPPDIDPKPPIANAGQSQTIQLPDTATLSGTGTSSNGKITGYLWSLISGPNIPDIHSPSSPATTLTNLVAGTYRFQFMIVDSAGLSGIDTTSLTLILPPEQTITLQPSNALSDFANIAEINGSNATSHEKDVDAAVWTINGDPVFIRGAMRFDMSQIPAKATIISAKLTLFSIHDPVNGDLVNANSGANNAMYVRRIISNWDGATVNWQTQPAITVQDQILIPHTDQAFLDLVDVDVKTLVQAMHTDSNNGLMITLQNEMAYTSRQFCSSYYSDATKHPKLVITYQ